MVEAAEKRLYNLYIQETFMNKDELRILQVGDVLVSPNIITEKFCCDLDACKGECCIEGDAGAERKFSMVPLQRNTRTAARTTASPTCTKASEKMMA